MTSGSRILFTITLELRMILPNISRRVVDNVLMNISPSNIFLHGVCLQDFIKIVRQFLAAVSINGLNHLYSQPDYFDEILEAKVKL